MKKFSYIFIVFSIVVTLFQPALTFAQSDTELQAKIEETRRQRDALLERQKQLQLALDELNKEGKTLQTTVKSLDAARAKLANDLKITQTNIGASNLEITKLGNEINKNMNEILDHKAAIRDSLKKLSSYDGHNVIFDLLLYDNLTDVWTDTADLMDTQDALGEAINALQNTQRRLLENRTAKEVKKIELVSLSTELRGQKQVVEDTQKTKTQLLVETRSKEVLYQQMLAENVAREKEFETQLFQFESQLKAAGVSAIPVPGRGVLAWPLESVAVTQQFGRTSSSGRLYASGSHNGVDFRSSVGSKVLAIRGGVVDAVGNTDDQRGCYSYGRWILIRHDNGLSSLYAHLSASIVVLGQAVSSSQTIGYSGGAPRSYGSGYSTGPHLHLGLFVTAGAQVLQYTASINCKNVSIPLANPQDYLDPLVYMPSL